jgi:transcriptional regulator with XRE-family HTH domain
LVANGDSSERHALHDAVDREKIRMASVHPIMDELREKRIKRGMTLSKLARVANLSRESIRKRETRKFPQLMVLDRWCRALGYKLTLTEIDPPLPNQQRRDR